MLSFFSSEALLFFLAALMMALDLLLFLGLDIEKGRWLCLMNQMIQNEYIHFHRRKDD